MVHRAVEHRFSTVHKKLNQPNVLSIQVQFFRLLFPSKAQISFRDIHLGKSASTAQFTVIQNEKDCIAGMVNLQVLDGYTFKTSWNLAPAPCEASIGHLSTDSDPRWVSYQCPYHPEGFRRVQSYVKFFVPLVLKDPTYLDQWFTPSDPGDTFSNETIGFVADLSLPILDNFFGKDCSGSHEHILEVADQQKRDREMGIHRVVDASSGAYESKGMIMTMSSNIEIKKRLPPDGVKWLFMRAIAKQIKAGRLSMEVILLDENGDLVAVSSQVLPIIDLERQKRNKQRL
ncbi:MAG: hypothetical protein M1820_001247 [Bogoriella megaspora]|nr:MAG: hypothetical protein M1820_001247 [Bogoriella megaspora]